MKSYARHAGNSRGQGDEGSDHGQQTPEKYGKVAPTGKESVGPVEFVAANQDPTAILLYNAPAAVEADFIGE